MQKLKRHKNTACKTYFTLNGYCKRSSTIEIIIASKNRTQDVFLFSRISAVQTYVF